MNERLTDTNANQKPTEHEEPVDRRGGAYSAEHGSQPHGHDQHGMASPPVRQEASQESSDRPAGKHHGVGHGAKHRSTAHQLELLDKRAISSRITTFSFRFRYLSVCSFCFSLVFAFVFQFPSPFRFFFVSDMNPIMSRIPGIPASSRSTFC